MVSKLGEYGNFSVSEIYKLIKAKINKQVILHCAFCLLAKRLVGKPIKTIIDVGAHNGGFSRGAEFIFPNAKIYAFEPTKLCSKIKGKNIKAYNIGLWGESGFGTFYGSYNLDGTIDYDGSFFKNIQANKKYKKLNIPRKRFDELDIKIEKPCFVKIDTEGAELEVLKGFGNKLKEVDVIQLEILYNDTNNLDKIVKLLRNYGFNGMIQPITTWRNNMPMPPDLIFFRDNLKWKPKA